MSPTIALAADGTVEVVAGGSGGPRIITGTVQAMLNVLVFDMSAEEAVESPRFHHQWQPDVLALETSSRAGAPETPLSAIRETLRAKGHEVADAASVGVVQLIRRVSGGYGAASDPRKGGAPAGR